MATTTFFKDLIDIPEWRGLGVAPNASAAGVGICSDLRNSEDRIPYIYQLASATVLNAYNAKQDGWYLIGSPALTGTFGAGAGCVFAPQRGPRGTLTTGSTTTVVNLSTALPAAVGINQLADRGDGRGYKIRIIGLSSGGSGKTEERLIVANTSGTTPSIEVDSAFSFTPASTDAYEILSGRVYLLSAGTLAAGCWKYYDVATNSFSGNLATTNLPATISTDCSLVSLDEQYVPSTRNPGDGFFGNLVATGSSSTTLTGQAASGDAGVATNEYRNFQIRIVQDTSAPTAAGQRRKITSHTAGASPVYTVPSWTVTPSTNATYVIENCNEILLWSSASTNTHCYAQDAIGAQSADTWSTATYAVRGSAMAAGCSSFQGFGITLDTAKNARYSNIFSFRGGATASLDILDIAGASTGSWTNAATYSSGPTFTTGTSVVYNGNTNSGQYAYINQSGTQNFFRFNCRNRTMDPWAQLRFTQGAAVVGGKMAMTTFIDGSTKIALVYTLRNTGTELFQTLIQR